MLIKFITFYFLFSFVKIKITMLPIVQQIATEFKAELEKLREQIQNVPDRSVLSYFQVYRERRKRYV